jgi:hypothetical protein
MTWPGAYGEGALCISVRQSPGQRDESVGARWRRRLACRASTEPRRIPLAGTRRRGKIELDNDQLQALVLGLPWQRIGVGDVISML